MDCAQLARCQRVVLASPRAGRLTLWTVPEMSLMCAEMTVNGCHSLGSVPAGGCRRPVRTR